MSELHTSRSIHLLEQTRPQSLKAHLGVSFGVCMHWRGMGGDEDNPRGFLLCGKGDGEGIPTRMGSSLVL